MKHGVCVPDQWGQTLIEFVFAICGPFKGQRCNNSVPFLWICDVIGLKFITVALNLWYHFSSILYRCILRCNWLTCHLFIDQSQGLRHHGWQNDVMGDGSSAKFRICEKSPTIFVNLIIPEKSSTIFYKWSPIIKKLI